MFRRILLVFGLALFGLHLGFQSQQLAYKKRDPIKKTGLPPVLFVLHGYGASEEDLYDLASTFDDRLMIFSLRAPIALNNGGFCWYRLDRDQQGKLLYDYKDAVASRKMIMSFIQSSCRNFHADSSSVYLMGFSQGSMLSYDIAIANPGKIKGVLALSGRLMEQSAALPTNWAKVAGTSFFIGHGSEDNLISVKEAEKARDLLTAKGIKNLQYKSYTMEHSLNGQEIIDIRAWLSARLSEKPAAGKK